MIERILHWLIYIIIRSIIIYINLYFRHYFSIFLPYYYTMLYYIPTTPTLTYLGHKLSAVEGREEHLDQRMSRDEGMYSYDIYV